MFPQGTQCSDPRAKHERGQRRYVLWTEIWLGVGADPDAGDMYFMGLSATNIFKHWPEMSEEYSGISLHDAWIETFKHDGARMFPPTKVADRLKTPEGVNPGTFQMRPLIYTMLLEQVKRLGITIEFGKKVVDYFEDSAGQKGGVKLQDGTELTADVVIAADGVGSKSQQIVGGQVRARSSGRAMWRAVFPREELEKYEDTKEFFALKDGNEPIVRTFFGYAYDCDFSAQELVANDIPALELTPSPLLVTMWLSGL